MSLKKRRLNKKGKTIILFITFVLLVIYFITDLSKITSIDIQSNGQLSTSEILKLADVEQGSFQLFTFDFFVKQRLESHPLIERAHVENIFFSKLRIQIFERPVYGFFESEDQIYFVGSNASIFQIEEDDLRIKIMGSVPKIILPYNDQGQLETYVLNDLVTQLARINSDSFAQISEIEYKFDSAGFDLVVTMTHPNRIRFHTRIDYLVNAMRYYYELVYQINDTDICIFMFSETRAIPEKCK